MLPGFVLWCVGFVLVMAYYFHAPTHIAIDRVIGLRTRVGLLFPILATALCGGILPLLYLRTDPLLREDYRLKNCIFLTAFWAYKGFEVDLWYRLLAHGVGAGHTAGTITIKCLLDQFVYCPIWAVPITVLAFAFNHAGLRIAPLLADFRAGGWYRRHVLPALLANLMIWVPVVCLVYALPVPLQTPLFDLVLCFFILIMAHVTRRKNLHDRKGD